MTETPEQPAEHADLEAEHADLLSAGPVPPAEAVTRLRIAGILDDHGPVRHFSPVRPDRRNNNE